MGKRSTFLKKRKKKALTKKTTLLSLTQREIGKETLFFII